MNNIGGFTGAMREASVGYAGTKALVSTCRLRPVRLLHWSQHSTRGGKSEKGWNSLEQAKTYQNKLKQAQIIGDKLNLAEISWNVLEQV